MISELLSGLLGAILGAIAGGLISYRGAMDSAKNTIDALYKQELNRRNEDKKDKTTLVIKSLLTETKENENITANWKTGHSKAPLNDEAWSIFKGSIEYLPNPMQEELISTYSDIRRYNSLIEYDKIKVPYGHGSMDSSIQTEAGKMQAKLSKLISSLSETVQ